MLTHQFNNRPSEGAILSILFFIVLILSSPLFSSNLTNGHDAIAGLNRVIEMSKFIGDGQLFVRWVPEVNLGYGSPMFNFYPPFVSLLATLISMVVHHAIVALNLTLILLWFLAAWGMYLLGKKIWNESMAGFLSSLVYIFSPYYIQDIYIRGAYAEFAAFSFFPWIIYLMLLVNEEALMKRVFSCILVMAAAILTHFLCILFIGVSLIYIIINNWIKKNHQASLITVGMVIIAFMLTCFFWLPAGWDVRFLNTNFIISMRYDFHKNFITLAQMFPAPWQINNVVFENVSLELGWISCLGVLFSAIAFFVRRIQSKFINYNFIFWVLFSLSSVLMAHRVSTSIWEHISALKYLQFPWRLLSFYIFSSALLVGSLALYFTKNSSKTILLIVFICLSLIFGAKFFSNPSMVKLNIQEMKDSLTTVMILGEGERTPQWIKIPPSKGLDSKFILISGDASLDHIQRISAVEYSSRINVRDNSIVAFESFYFPGWRVLIDGQQAAINPDNPWGIIMFYIPKGDHEINVKFTYTKIRLISCVISWVAVSLCLGMFLFFKKSYLLSKLNFK